MAPVEKRLTISLTGSTSSMSTGSRVEAKVISPRREAISRAWLSTRRV